MCEEYVVGGTSTVEGYRVGQGMGVCKVNGFIIFSILSVPEYVLVCIFKFCLKGNGNRFNQFKRLNHILCSGFVF